MKTSNLDDSTKVPKDEKLDRYLFRHTSRKVVDAEEKIRTIQKCLISE